MNALVKVEEDEEEATAPQTNLEELVTLAPAQMERLRFPPGCVVVHTDMRESPPKVLYGSVERAYLDFESRKCVYKMDEHEILCAEEHLQFAKGVPVSALISPSDKPVNAVVLQSCLLSLREPPVYSLEELDSQIIHHSVPSSSLSYRRERNDSGSRKKAAVVNGSTANTSNYTEKPHSIAVNPGTSVVSRETAPALTMASEEAAEQRPVEHQDNYTSLLLSSPLRSKRPLARSAGEQPSSPKRPRRSLEAPRELPSVVGSPLRANRLSDRASSTGIGRAGGSTVTIVLPKRVPKVQVQESLLAEYKEIESKHACEIRLLGFVFQKNPKIGVNMYLEITGTKMGIEKVVHWIGDVLIASQIDKFPDNVGPRRVILHDLAKTNLKYYQHDGPLVYQSERVDVGKRDHWKWMCVLDMKGFWDYEKLATTLIGPNNRGINEIRGKTKCCIHVAETEKNPRPCIYISGSDVHVKDCLPRARHRIKWAMKRHMASKPSS